MFAEHDLAFRLAHARRGARAKGAIFFWGCSARVAPPDEDYENNLHPSALAKIDSGTATTGARPCLSNPQE
jgi:hypothetical protein